MFRVWFFFASLYTYAKTFRNVIEVVRPSVGMVMGRVENTWRCLSWVGRLLSFRHPIIAVQPRRFSSEKLPRGAKTTETISNHR